MNESCHGSYSKNTKKHLNTITRNHRFSKETLYTYLTEIGSIINGRPLNPLSDDINNFEVLMPDLKMLRE